MQNPATQGARIVVIGGSAAGLSTALAFSNTGHRVTILEKEVLPRCETPLEAFEKWERRGAAQTRHSHAFLARLHNDLLKRAPDLYQALIDAGAERLRFKDMVNEIYTDPEFIPEDDEIVLLGCRRITYDWVLRRYVETHTETDYRDGCGVEGLVSETDPASGLPRVTGVRVRNAEGEEEVIEADLVLNASGRNAPMRKWLEEIGSEPLEQESESCGIFYCSRFYKLRDGVETPSMDGPMGADLGYMKYGIFLGDSRIFSITLAASPKDDALRRLRDADFFHATSEHLPTTRKWVDPAISEPITDVYTYANLKNTRRFFATETQPLALGFFPVGDANLHVNPISGRGCTLAWVSAHLLADAWAEHGPDPLAFAQAAQAAIQREIVPWYEVSRDQDRAAGESSSVEAEGGDPFAFERADGTIDPKAYMRSLMRDGLMPALREDLNVLRAFMRVFNMLEAPQDLMATPGLLPRVLQVWQDRESRERISLGPSRSELLALVEAAAAAA